MGSCVEFVACKKVPFYFSGYSAIQIQISDPVVFQHLSCAVLEFQEFPEVLFLPCH